VINIKFEQTT